MLGGLEKSGFRSPIQTLESCLLGGILLGITQYRLCSSYEKVQHQPLWKASIKLKDSSLLCIYI